MRLLRKVAARRRNGAAALVVSGGYAVIVVGVAAFVAIASLLQPGSIAGIWLILVTLPASLLVLLIPAEGNPLILLMALGGLAQAGLLWLALRGKRLPYAPEAGSGEHS